MVQLSRFLWLAITRKPEASARDPLPPSLTLRACVAMVVLLTSLAFGQATERISLQRDRQSVHLLQAAEDALREQGWLQAFEALAQLLRRPDCLIEIDEIRGDSTVTRLAGVHSEALRLLQKLPEEGRIFRETYWGPQAADRLEQARKTHDAGALLAVARYFPTTTASILALEELARTEDQAGRPTLAILALQQLRRLQPEAEWPAERRRLAERIKSRAKPQETDPANFWPLVGGNAARSALGRGQGFTMSPLWTKQLGIVARSSRWISDAETLLEQAGQPVPVAGYPLVVANPQPGQPPLVLFRNRAGLQVVKSDSGNLVWRTASPWSLDGMIGKPEKAEALDNWVTDYLETLQQPGVLFENSTAGTLSTDGNLVYLVEDLAVVPTIEMASRFLLSAEVGTNLNPIDAVQHNQLNAYDLITGKLRWKAGGRGAEAGELADSFFLGPPLPADDRLYVLNEKDREIRLLTLDPLNGLVLAVQPLVRTSKALLEEPRRRMWAAHPALAEGVLVCPTNAGAVLAVDVLTGSLLWAHRYQEARAGSPSTSVWQNEPPCIVDGKVLLAPPDAEVINCLDLHTGARLWGVRRKAEDVSLAGVARGKVLIAGKKTCRALNLSKGEPLWTVETGLPSGRAAVAGGRLFLPLRAGVASGKPEVCVVDLTRGKIETKLRSRREQVPGTLIFGPGVVLSLTPMDLTAFPLAE